MKLHKLFTLSMATVAFACFTVNGYSQEAAEAAATPGAAASEGGAPAAESKSDKSDKAELKGKIRAARKAAMDDPTVAEARKTNREASRAHFQAERAALVEKDPSLAESFKHRGPRPPKAEGEDGAAEKPKGERRRERPSPEQMEKMRALRESVQEVPAVKEAAAKRDATKAAYKDALKAALTKADPTLDAEVVDKLATRMSEHRGGRGPGRHGRHGHHGRHGGPKHGPDGPHGGPHQEPPVAPDAPADAPDAPDAGGEDDA